MEIAIVLLVCAIATVDGQIVNPISSAGMTNGWGNPMWHSGMRYPGMMQASHLSSMTYPAWRSHPIFRVVSATSDKNVGSDVTNVPKVQPAHELLTHMALVNANVKPYLDTIADFLYEPQKTRTVLAPVATVASVAPVAPVASVAPVAPVASVAPVAQMTPVYVQGMNLMRTSSNGEDCGPQDGTRWERGLDWLY